MRWNHEANGYRLPTEAEWEYAARGGQLSKGYKYPGSNNIDEVNKESAVSYEIGQMKPNELGVHDMGGLVSEYCYDWYDKKMWEWLPQENPCFETLSMLSEDKLPKPKRGISQLSKVYKGADRDENLYASSHYRFSLLLPHSSTIGIRLVRNYDEKQEKVIDYIKTDFNTYEEKQGTEVSFVISKDGTVKLIGTNLDEETTVVVMEKLNSKIVDKPFDIRKGKINDTRVRLRSEPNLESETLSYFYEGSKVRILDQTDKPYEIDGESYYWYKVESGTYPVGWVYGKYLDIENE